LVIPWLHDRHAVKLVCWASGIMGGRFGLFAHLTVDNSYALVSAGGKRIHASLDA